MFVLDLDGATLDDEKNLPQPVAEKNQKKNHIIAFASGRPYAEMQQYDPSLPCIFFNDAGIRLPK